MPRNAFSCQTLVTRSAKNQQVSLVRDAVPSVERVKKSGHLTHVLLNIKSLLEVLQWLCRDQR